jgi:uncharacterized membrane protein
MEAATITNLIDNNRWQIDPSSFNGGQDPDRLIRYLPDINRESLDEVVTALKAIPTIQIPQAQNKPWAGTWYCGRIYLDYDREKKLSLFQVLHKGGTTVDDIRILNGCAYRYTSTIYLSQTTIISLPASTSGVEYERSPVNKDNDTGRFTFSITKKERLTQEIAAYTAERQADEYVTRRQITGLRSGDVDHNGTAVSIPSMTNQVAGTIVDISRQKNPDCTQDVAEQQRISIENSAIASDKTYEAFEIQGTVEGKNVVTEPTLPTTQTAGFIVTLRKKLNAFLRWDVITQTRESVAQAAAGGAKTITALETEVDAEGRNIEAEPALPTTQTAGAIVTLRKKLNAFLRWDTQTNTRTATTLAAEASDKTIDAFEKAGTVEDKNTVSEPTLPTTQTAGAIVTLRKKLNAFLRWDVITQTRESVAQAAAGAGKTIKASETEEETEGRNIEAEPTLPTTQTAGTIVTMRKKLNAFLRWDTQTNTRTATYLYDSGSYTTREGTVYWWWGSNATSTQYNAVISAAALTNATDNHISKTTNDYNLISYMITKNPFSGGVYLWAESELGPYTRKDRQYAHLFSESAGRVRRFRRDVTYTYSMGIKHSYEAAHSYQSGGEDGSTVQSHGNGRYVGIKVTGISEGNWALDETGVS